MSALVSLIFFLTPEAPYLAPYLETSIEEAGSNPRHADCIRLVAKDLEIGRIAAQQWTVEGGGMAAQHCLAIADLAAGFPRLAAARLVDIAEKKDVGDVTVQARLWTQAALAWLDANDAAEATAAIEKAIALEPGNAATRIIAAKVYSAADRWQLAEDAITDAKSYGIETPEGFVIRARARRALGRDMAAAEDVANALNIDPFNLDALVIRGELQQAGINIEAYYGDNDDTEEEFGVE
ncbi:MAG: hypothetical protein R3C51_10730 [Parvularculaceae bacterium]